MGHVSLATSALPGVPLVEDRRFVSALGPCPLLLVSADNADQLGHGPSVCRSQSGGHFESANRGDTSQRQRLWSAVLRELRSIRQVPLFAFTDMFSPRKPVERSTGLPLRHGRNMRNARGAGLVNHLSGHRRCLMTEWTDLVVVDGSWRVSPPPSLSWNVGRLPDCVSFSVARCLMDII